MNLNPNRLPPIESVDDLFAQEVRAELARKKRTVTAVAKESGIPRSPISDRVNGRVPFSTADAVKVCRVIRVDANEILARDPITVLALVALYAGHGAFLRGLVGC